MASVLQQYSQLEELGVDRMFVDEAHNYKNRAVRQMWKAVQRWIVRSIGRGSIKCL